MLSDQEIARVSSSSDAELLVEIGRSIEEHEGLAAFPSRERMFRKGQLWFDEFMVRAKTLICRDPRIREYLEGKAPVLSQSIGLIALALADAALAPPVPIATVSALIVRRGVESLCADAWKS